MPANRNHCDAEVGVYLGLIASNDPLSFGNTFLIGPYFVQNHYLFIGHLTLVPEVIGHCCHNRVASLQTS